MLGKIERRRRGQHRIRWWDGTSGHEFEQIQGDSEGQGSLACCSMWGQKAGYNLGTEQQVLDMLFLFFFFFFFAIYFQMISV